MNKFELNIGEVIVTAKNKELDDWSGETFGGTIGITKTFSVANLDSAVIVDVVKNTLGLSDYITESDFYFCNGVVGSVAVVENGEGLPDPDGDFLADYYFTIKPIEAFLDLEQLFGE